MKTRRQREFRTWMTMAQGLRTERQSFTYVLTSFSLHSNLRLFGTFRAGGTHLDSERWKL
jgi:hypothetical protein